MNEKAQQELLVEEAQLERESKKTERVRNPEELTDTELREKMEDLSSNIFLSRNQFIAYLPEVKKRRLWDDGEFTSAVHYAKVKACLREKTIIRVFKLYEKIEPYPAILKLFQEVIVGWSKIEIVAPVLTSKNARHFANRLQSNTTSTLKRLVQNIRATNSKDNRCNNRQDIRQDNRQDNRQEGRFTTNEASLSQTSEAIAGFEQLSTKTNAGHEINNAMIKPSTIKPAAQATNEQSTFAFSLSSRQREKDIPCEACGHIKGTSTRPGGGRRLVPLNVTPIVRDMYEQLLHRWKRRDKKVTMNEVVERVMLAALEMGIDLTFDGDIGPTEYLETNEADNDTGTEITASNDVSSRSGKDKAATASNDVSSRSGKDKAATGSTDVSSRSSKPMAARTSTWWKRMFVQLVNYDVKTGACFTKTYDGWERVSEQELAYRTALYNAPIDLKELRLEAKECAAEYMRKYILNGKEISDYIPEPIRKYIGLRSQGFCEFPGCKNRGCTLHHIKRFVLDPDCDPDGLIFICEECEKLFHDSVVVNESGPFDEFKIREDYVPQTEGEKKRAAIDAKVQSWRQGQGKESEPYPTAGQLRRRMRLLRDEGIILPDHLGYRPNEEHEEHEAKTRASSQGSSV